jgi:hypothetical protein
MFVDCERRLLNLFNSTFEYPTVDTFLTRFLAAITANDTLEHLSHFACEVSLLYFEFNQFRRSVTAFSAILIAAALTGELELLPISLLVQYSHFEDLSEVSECTRSLAGAVDGVLSAKNSPTYTRMIAGSAVEARIRPATIALEQLRKFLIKNTRCC